MIFAFWFLLTAVVVLCQMKLFFFHYKTIHKKKIERDELFQNMKKKIERQEKRKQSFDHQMKRIYGLKQINQDLQDIFKDIQSKRPLSEKIVIIRNKITHLFQCRSVRLIVIDCLDFSKSIPRKVLDLSLLPVKSSKSNFWKAPRDEDYKICTFLSMNGFQKIAIFNTKIQTIALKIGLNNHLSSFVVIPLIFENNLLGCLVFENIDAQDLEKAKTLSRYFLLCFDDLCQMGEKNYKIREVKL